MSCLENINRYIVTSDIINTLTAIYQHVGRNKQYLLKTKKGMDKIIRQTIECDAFYLSKIIGINLTDARLRLIIKKNSAPRTKEEAILFNLLSVLNDIMHNYRQFTLSSSSELNLINYLYQNQNIKFVAGKDENKTKRMILEEYNDLFIKHEGKIEPIILALSYFVDFMNLKPLSHNNNTLGFIILLLLLLRADIDAFKYVSLFELIYQNYSSFNNEFMAASYNWKSGFPQPNAFISFMMTLIHKAYINTEEIVTGYQEDKNTGKSDNIENTINNLPATFTKEQIRIKHPYVSESTINRALQKLKDENKIKPTGKGRSAKWKKVPSAYL